MVRDDDGEPAILGKAHRLRLGDAGVASQQHADRRGRCLQDLAQSGQADAVPFGEAVGHVKAHLLLAGQRAQRRHQERGARLPVDVEIAPHQDRRVVGDGLMQQFGGGVHASQRRRRRGRVLVGVEKGDRLLRRVEPALGQQLSDELMSTRDGDQFRRWGDGRLDDPGLLHLRTPTLPRRPG